MLVNKFEMYRLRHDVYQITNVFNKKNLFVFEDFHMTDDYIDQILAEYGVPYIMFNNFYSKIETVHNIYCIPLAFYNTSLGIVNGLSQDEQNEIHKLKTNYCFNFNANRKRINRFLMIKLVEWFGLTSMDYTWSAADQNYDMSNILKEIKSISSPPWTSEFSSFILTPIQLPKKWIEVDGDVEVAQLQIRSKNNSEVWNQGLNQLCSLSAVSLISESIDYQNGIGYSEKTAFALLACTFPIWIGGKYQAEQFSRLGYDIFDDIIDHSYQYHNTLIERCYYAIANNLEILTNLEHSTRLRNTLQKRLNANRQKIIHNCLEFTRHMLDPESESISNDLQQSYNTIPVDPVKNIFLTDMLRNIPIDPEKSIFLMDMLGKLKINSQHP
jgi:hypothetical protein